MGALQKLRVARDYDLTSSADSAFVPYDSAVVSWPSGEIPVVALSELLGTGGQHEVIYVLRTHVRRRDAAGDALRAAGLRQAYGDPKLRGRRAYARFVRELWDRKHAVFASSCSETVEVFLVSKSNGRQRLIVDCRRANYWLSDPDHTPIVWGRYAC